MTADMAQAHRSDGKSIDILGREISPEPRPPTTRSRHYGEIVSAVCVSRRSAARFESPLREFHEGEIRGHDDDQEQPERDGQRAEPEHVAEWTQWDDHGGSEGNDDRAEAGAARPAQP